MVTFDEASHAPVDPARDPELVLAVDEALCLLESAKPRLGRVVELKFFAGLNSNEIADLLGVTARTVERDWAKARAYLYRLLSPDAGDSP